MIKNLLSIIEKKAIEVKATMEHPDIIVLPSVFKNDAPLTIAGMEVIVSSQIDPNTILMLNLNSGLGENNNVSFKIVEDPYDNM